MEEKKITVKQVSEKDFLIEENRVYLGDDNIVYDIGAGDSNKEFALTVKETILKLANMVEGKANLFVDLTNAGKPISEARKVYLSIAEHDKIGKVALFGINPVARVLAAFIMGVTGKKDIRFFGKREEAISWLREGTK